MCTYLTEKVSISGSGKGPAGWFRLTDASVYFDHPVRAQAEHTLNIDFLDPGAGPSARVAVEAHRGIGPGPGQGHPGHPGLGTTRPDHLSLARHAVIVTRHRPRSFAGFRRHCHQKRRRICGRLLGCATHS